MILVLGVAGSGKSTQSKLLAEKMGWQWISMGQLLRENLRGELADELNSGKLVDDTKVQAILVDALQKNIPKGTIVLDGFPRRLVQAQWLIPAAAELGDAVDAVVHLQAHETVVFERLLKRGRLDDQPDAINERFLEYEKDIKPILELAGNKSIPVVEVDGENPPNQVTADVLMGLQHLGVAV